MIRTLPIRLEPAVGESLTSWLCAMAGRNQVTWHQILTAVGLHRRPGDTKRLGWAGNLNPPEITDLAISTDIEVATLTSMTFSHFEPTGITTGRRPRQPYFGAAHGARPVRFCPRCLVDSGGRWQLRWSLGWSFACIEHACLLSDVCPQCGRPAQRKTPYAHRIPDLTACSQRTPGERATVVCGADLRQHTDATSAAAETVNAQRTIDAVIAGVDRFPLYGVRPITTRQILADLRRTAAHVLTNLDRSDPAISRTGPGSALAPAAGLARTAAAYTAAVEALQAPNIAEGSARLRPRLAASATTPNTILRRNSSRNAISTEALALQLAALGPHLRACQQLRYRTHTSFPRAPRRPETTLAKVTRGLPTLIWPSWAHRISPAAGTDTATRAALSCAVALVGTDADLAEVASLLGIRIDPRELSAALERLRRQAEWPRSAAAITALSDLLIGQKIPPIDYHRRRRIDYTPLLPSDEWEYLRSDLGLQVDSSWGADPARCALFEQLSGLPIGQAPWFHDDPAFYATCRWYADLAADDVAGTFTAIADRFLCANGIDEPSFAQPNVSQL